MVGRLAVHLGLYDLHSHDLRSRVAGSERGRVAVGMEIQIEGDIAGFARRKVAVHRNVGLLVVGNAVVEVGYRNLEREGMGLGHHAAVGIVAVEVGSRVEEGELRSLLAMSTSIVIVIRHVDCGELN